jgi:hypothetical protein
MKPHSTLESLLSLLPPGRRFVRAFRDMQTGVTNLRLEVGALKTALTDMHQTERTPSQRQAPPRNPVLPGVDADRITARELQILTATHQPLLAGDPYQKGDDRLRYHTDGKDNHIMKGDTDPRGKRVVEAHAVLPEVRDALASPAIVEFLAAIFDEPPVLTQSLIFQTGSEQPHHQDTAFVVFDEPLKMAASWIALEDIHEGSGELQYIVESHRMADYVFSNGRKDSHGAGVEEVPAFLAKLLSESKKQGLTEKTFLARKGDGLIWHADLAHGGSPVLDSNATRKSLVGHFCPTSVSPKYDGAQKRRKHGPLSYSSYLYDLDLT